MASQILQAQEQLRQQFDHEVQARVNALNIGNQVEQVVQVEMMNEGQPQPDQSMDTPMVSASRIRQRNQSNMIRNRSMNSSNDQ